MPRKFRLPGGDLEYSVLNTVWDLGRASARDIYERVGAPEGLVYTTIAKVLDRLWAKDLVRRTKIGNAFTYEPAIGRDVVERARTKAGVSHILGSRPRAAIALLVDAVESLDPTLLDELAHIVATKRRGHDGS